MNLIFVGGQITADNKAQAVGKDMATQTRNVFQFIRSVLREGGLDESDVAKLDIYYHAPAIGPKSPRPRPPSPPFSASIILNPVPARRLFEFPVSGLKTC